MTRAADLARDLDLLRHDAAAVDRSDRGFVCVTGDDARSFLQALVSADLDPVEAGAGTRSLLLAPRGKLDVAFRLLAVGDGFWLDCDPGLGGQLAASLNRYRIRVKADILDQSGVWGMVSLIGPAALKRWGGAVPGTLHAHQRDGDVLVVHSEFGLDLLGPHRAVAAALASLGAAGWSVGDPLAYEAFRIEQGIPVQPVDIDETTIPQEAGLERDAVSFTKGCFVGQELVCRIDTRGHVNRYLRRFGSIEGAWPARGADVVAGGKVVGTLTSVAPVELPTGALGYVRREVEPPATVELRWDGGRAAAVLSVLAS